MAHLRAEGVTTGMRRPHDSVMAPRWHGRLDNQSSHDSMMAGMPTRRPGRASPRPSQRRSRDAERRTARHARVASTPRWSSSASSSPRSTSAPPSPASAPLLEEVRDGLGMSGTVAGLLTSVPAALLRRLRRHGAAAGPPLRPRRRRLRRHGRHRRGPAIRPFAGGTAGFLAASALALMGIAVSNVLMPVIVKRWFPDRVGSMTGLYSMALALGTAAAAAVTVPMTEALGGSWRIGLGRLGGARRGRRTALARRSYGTAARPRAPPRPAPAHGAAPAAAAAGARRRCGSPGAAPPGRSAVLLRPPGHRRVHHHGLDAADLPGRGGLRPAPPGCCSPSPW